MNAKTTNKKYLVLKYTEFAVFALALLLAFVGVSPLGTNTGFGIFGTNTGFGIFGTNTGFGIF